MKTHSSPWERVGSAARRALIAKRRRHLRHLAPYWTPEEERLLGTAPDEELAQKLNRPEGAVEARRKKLHIRAWNSPYSFLWTPEEEALLGVVPDEELARRSRRTVEAVAARRRKAGLPKVDSKRRRLTPEEAALLGTMPDLELAQRFNRTLRTVQVFRRRLGIRSCNGLRPLSWTPQEEALLGVVPDEEMATRFKRTLRAVQHRRWGKHIPAVDAKRRRFTPREDALLGTMPDKEAAVRLNRHVKCVATRRRRLGVALFALRTAPAFSTRTAASV
jgi:hypothetical protein